MNIRLSILIIIASIILWSSSSYAQDNIVINEFMASNASTIADEDGDYEDWIELYNPTNQSVNLHGWGLSDDADNPMRWVFPEVEIPAQEFLLVWASGKDRIGNTLHSNFSISAAGEPLLLSTSNGVLVDFIQPTQLHSDVSYGRKPDGGPAFYYFEEPSPEASNIQEGFTGILPNVEFNRNGGFYQESPLYIALTHPNPSALIIYSLDGSEPCLNNLTPQPYLIKDLYPFYPNSDQGVFIEKYYQSETYQNPIKVTNRQDTQDKLTHINTTVQKPNYFPKNPVFKGNTIRAKAYLEGWIPSEVTTHSFFISPQGRSRYKLPVISLNIQEDYLFDYEKGIYVPGIEADKWRENNPNEKFRWPYPGNFNRRGAEWEYPAVIELFPENQNSSAFNQTVGIRIHGGATRSFPMKSLRLYARKRYGNEYIDHPIFNNDSNGGFKRLLLRNSGNDFTTSYWEPNRSSRTMFRDAAMHKISESLSFDTQNYQPSILFINGEYWGIINIRERYDRYYFQRTYNIEENKLDLLSGFGTVKEGDKKHFEKTYSFINNNDLNLEENYAIVETLIDIQNFIDYQITNIFANNTDWPGNNMDYFRYKTDTFIPTNPKAKDGRWRWLMFDMDFGLGLWGGEDSFKNNTLVFATEADGPDWPNPSWSTLYLRKLLNNPSFKQQFLVRFSDLLNTALHPNYTVFIIDSLQNNIESEIEEHFARWAPWESKQSWNHHVEVMREFAKKRPIYQKKHLREFFNIESYDQPISLDATNHLHGHVKINTIDIKGTTAGVDNFPYPWQGWYFKNIPISISAHPAPGYRFIEWSGNTSGTSERFAFNPISPAYFKAHFEPTFEPLLIHYWYFDQQLPNNEPLEKIQASFSISGEAFIEFRSCLPGYPYPEEHAFRRKASMERRNSPTPLNYRPEGNNDELYNPETMRAIQIKQPFIYNNVQSELIFHLPAIGAQDLFFSFAAKDEGAAYGFVIEYATDENETWITQGLKQNQFNLSSSYQLFLIDLSQLEGIETQENFKIRIRILSHNPESFGEGNVSFNNFSLDGVICMAHTIETRKTGSGEVYPLGNVGVYECGSREFTIQPMENHYIQSLTLDGHCILNKLQQTGENTYTLTLKSPKKDRKLNIRFQIRDDFLDEDGVLVYPNPATDRVGIASAEDIKSVSLYNMQGILLKNENFDTAWATLSLANIKPGIYLLVIYWKEKRMSRKLIVQSKG